MIQAFQSFAKINLFLYVTGRRDDGYHELISLMTRIDLHDDIQIDFNALKLSVSCSHPEVPEDNSNLALKAARLFYRQLADHDAGVQNRISIHIGKTIPPGGGLGGGSSNAATVLSALNDYHGSPFSRQQLMAMGLKLGADIPFFIFGKPSIARGVGEKLEPIENLKPYYLVLCDPGVSSSTADVYKNIDFRLTFGQKRNIKTGLNVPLRGQVLDAVESLHNDLEESACRLYPEIGQAKKEMSVLLGRKVHMSGSGSSLFTLYPSLKDAEAGFEYLSEKWSGSRRKVFLSSFV